MPEIKNTFTQGKMNKDLDERIVPNGQYRDAMNIQVSTSEGSDVGAVQNILGNTEISLTLPDNGFPWECVGSIADEKNDVLYSFITDDIDSAIVEYAKDETVTPVLVDLGNLVLNFSTGDIITGINVIDDLLLWTDGVNEPKKINIQRCKDGSGVDLTTHTKLVVDGSIVLDTSGVQVNIAEEHITVIKKKPLRPLSVKINPADPSDKKPLFEKIFPRFSYRYRYEDGEYSAFAPFTDVVFNSEYSYDQNGIEYYDENTAYDTKEPYNSGMRNMIQSVELSDFISPDMLEDVVQVDLLYKQENSSVIYIVEIIKNTDTEWVVNGFNPSSAYKGNFTVSSENIYAALPENQLLRPWDNVPKTALAQEVTGSRLVYGNYTQSYDLGVTPKVISDYKLKFHGFQEIHEGYNWGVNFSRDSDFSLHTAGVLDEWNHSVDIIYNSTNENTEWDNVLSQRRIYQNLGGFETGARYRVKFNVSTFNNGMNGELYIRLTDSLGNHLSFNNYTPIIGENILEGTLVSTPNYPSTTWNGILQFNKFEIGVNIGSTFTGIIDDVEVQKGTKKDYKTFLTGGFPSVKSQRNYQLGVVYGDKYGRETPVFTSKESSVVIPWENDSLANSPLASHSLQLKAYLDSYHPDWADYYKFFVKETSGEYYNLVMDAMYNPTKEDLEKDEHVWLSFASSDRNKISEEDYIILKKKVIPDFSNISLQVEEENKFKVLDVKNEAPDAIKYKYLKMGEVANDASDSTGLLNKNYANGGLFHEPNYRPFSNNDKNMLYINKEAWSNIGGSRLVEGDDSYDGEQKVVENLYFSFTKTDVNVVGDNQSSQKKYRVVSVEVEGTTNPYYKVKLYESITESDDDLIRATPGSITDKNIHKDITVRFEKKLIKDSEAFSGRFFVKILSNNLIKSELEVNPTSLLDVIQNYNTEVTAEAFWHTDTITQGVYDIEAGLINNNGSGSVPSSNNVTSITNLFTGPPSQTTAGVTNTETAWDALLTSMGSNKWFIDNMYMVAVQTGEYARHATYGWLGGNANIDIGDVYESGAGSTSTNDPGVGWSVYHHQNSTGNMRYLTNNTIKPQNQTSTTGGDNLINGLEGVVTTTDMHVSNDYNIGLRRWRNINWDGNNTTSNLTNEYGTSVGKHFIHISFLGPGDNLHNGDFEGVTGSNTLFNRWNPASWWDKHKILANNTQAIFGGGVFTRSDPTDPGTRKVFMEVLTAVNQPYHSWDTCGYGKIDDDVIDPDYQSHHDNQWKLPSTDQAFANNLQVGKKFRFKDDDDKVIYTIKRSNYSNPKKVYNHTPWRKIWKVNTSGALIGMGNSVEEAATAWADTTNSGTSGAGDPSLQSDLGDRLQDFGNKNNRRLVYILELDKDPVQQTYNPVSGGTDMDSVNPDTIEFITEDFELNAGEISQNPAIWETEPKDNVDLDIYYEASQAIPITITEETRELFAPIGCRVDFPDDSRPLNGIDGSGGPQIITSQIYVGSWDGLELVFSQGINQYWDDNGIGESINYVGMKIKFTNQDGSYTTAIVTSASLDFDNPGFMKSVTIQPTTETGLSWYNCFSFGNGIESNRIRDDFNAMTITNGVRASSTLDRPYKKEHRKSGMIYSGIYNSTSGVNNLNQFVMAEKITKDLNPTYGSIQKLFQRRISLIAFCEDRIIGIVSGKDTLYNADGNPQIVASNAVLGDANPFVGDYGISKNPESFAKESYRAYFTDKQRGAVLRLSMDGLTPISDVGMSDWFKDEFKKPQYNIIGSYDNYKKDYNLTLDGGLGVLTTVSTSTSTPPRRTSAQPVDTSGDSYTLSFSEDVRGWTSFKSFIQESGISMSGDYYTFKGGKCYKHHEEGTEQNPYPRNTFYTVLTPSSIKFLLNESPTAIKNFNTLNYDGDKNWTCDSITTDQQSGSVTEFIEKEGKWFNYIKGDVKAALDTKAFNFQGIGMASNIQYSI